MIKKLSAIGSSLGFIIRFSSCSRSKKNTPLEVRTDGESLIVTPAKKQQLAK